MRLKLKKMNLIKRNAITVLDKVILRKVIIYIINGVKVYKMWYAKRYSILY